MKSNQKKKVTVKLKDGRCFKALLIGKGSRGQLIVSSEEYGEMSVDSRSVKN